MTKTSNVNIPFTIRALPSVLYHLTPIYLYMALKATKAETDNFDTHSGVFLKCFMLPALLGLLFGIGFSFLALYQQTEASNSILSYQQIILLFVGEIGKTLILSMLLGALFYYSLNKKSIEERPKHQIEGQLPNEQVAILHLKQKLAKQEISLSDIKLKLDYANELFDAAFYSNSQLQSLSDFDTGRFIDVNDTWVEVRGISREEAIGKTADELNIWGSTLHRQELIDDINELGRLRNYETLSVMRNGEHRDFILNAEVLSFRGQKLLFFSGLDITDQKKIRINLQRAQKLDAVGLLTGGIAHDFNNLLAIILGNLELANEVTTDNPNAQKLINSAIIGTQRGVSITDKLLSFSGGRPSGKEVTLIPPFWRG